MKIVIDLQGAQSKSSRNRGIGRYSLSLVKAIIANKGKHEIIIVLNALFPEATSQLYNELSQLLPLENIITWQAPKPLCFVDEDNTTRIQTAEKIREAFFASLNPDIILITSLFEGFEDDSVTSIGAFTHLPTAVILYDLIPLIHADHYLQNNTLKAWYMTKITSLKRADLLLSISESAKKEAHEHLEIKEEKVINISTAADTFFYKRHITDLQKKETKTAYKIEDKFIMYTGGIDYRKNIEGLIEAYALLPKTLIQEYQLAIVCSIPEIDKKRLTTLAKNLRVPPERIIFTGFIPDEDLVLLYNLCNLFVFPSWHEGFGLPALEAMLCGAVVIGSNISSLPEVIGTEEALFNPRDKHSISLKMQEVLTDKAMRVRLKTHAQTQAKEFSWDTTAIRALHALENKVDTLSLTKSHTQPIDSKPSLAYLSPLPPKKSGISDYSADLLPFLNNYYTIDIITDQKEIIDIDINHTITSIEAFKKDNNKYDRILYHFGNSEFHSHMFDLLEEIPGIVILHDFFLSGISSYIDFNGDKPGFLTQMLFRSHGYQALVEYYEKNDMKNILNKYPVNLAVLQNALGIIVHSDYAEKLRNKWYGSTSTPWIKVPLLRLKSIENERLKAKEALGYLKDAFIVCCFGFLDETKLNHRILSAYIDSTLSKNPLCHLIFVGDIVDKSYEKALKETIKSSTFSEQIVCTGWTDKTVYQSYLKAADISVQLRKDSRGESSATVLDCMSYGSATIVNANGTMAELHKDAVYMLSDEFSDDALREALELLYQEEKTREKLGTKAKEIIALEHNPSSCASQYSHAIEEIYTNESEKLHGLMQVFPPIVSSWKKNELIQLSVDLAQNFPPEPRQKQLLFDVSILFFENISFASKEKTEKILKKIFSSELLEYRIEPVYLKTGESQYKYARKLTSKVLNIPENILKDEPITGYPNDIFLTFNSHIRLEDTDIRKSLRHKGVTLARILTEKEEYLHRSKINVKDIHFFDTIITNNSETMEKLQLRCSEQLIKTKCLLSDKTIESDPLSVLRMLHKNV